VSEGYECNKCGQTSVCLIQVGGKGPLMCEPCLGRPSTKMWILPQRGSSERTEKGGRDG